MNPPILPDVSDPPQFTPARAMKADQNLAEPLTRPAYLLPARSVQHLQYPVENFIQAAQFQPDGATQPPQYPRQYRTNPFPEAAHLFYPEDAQALYQPDLPNLNPNYHPPARAAQNPQYPVSGQVGAVQAMQQHVLFDSEARGFPLTGPAPNLPQEAANLRNQPAHPVLRAEDLQEPVLSISQQPVVSPIEPQSKNRFPPVVLPHEMGVGNILLLPVQHNHVVVRCARNHKCDKGGIMDDGYGHPVVVMKIQQRRGSDIPGDLMCICAEVINKGDSRWWKGCYREITTFQQSSLKNWLEFQRLLKFRVALPIYQPNAPQPRVQPPIQQIYCIRGGLEKQSYVRLQHIWEIPMFCLWNWRFNFSTAYGVRLGQESYDLLMTKFELPPEPYEQLHELAVVAQWRRETLCGNTPNAPRPPISMPLVPRIGSICGEVGNNFRQPNVENRYAVQAAIGAPESFGPEGFVDQTGWNRALNPTAPTFQPHVNKTGGPAGEEIPLGYYAVPPGRATRF